MAEKCHWITEDRLGCQSLIAHGSNIIPQKENAYRLYSNGEYAEGHLWLQKDSNQTFLEMKGISVLNIEEEIKTFLIDMGMRFYRLAMIDIC